MLLHPIRSFTGPLFIGNFPDFTRFIWVKVRWNWELMTGYHSSQSRRNYCTLALKQTIECGLNFVKLVASQGLEATADEVSG